MRNRLTRACMGALLILLLSGCAPGMNRASRPPTQTPLSPAAALAGTAAAAIPDSGDGAAAADTPAAAVTPTTSAAQPATAYPADTAPAATQSALPTAPAAAPACASPAATTPQMTEGPYFKAGSPERTDLYAPGVPGTKLTLTGYVLDTDCQPVPGALLDFWQADGQGNYDNSGYTLRGHQTAGPDGSYHLVTVIPGLYPGRTEHIHVKVQAPGGPALTTQLFFPDVAQNNQDRIFDPRLLVTMQQGKDGATAQYTFIVVK